MTSGRALDPNGVSTGGCGGRVVLCRSGTGTRILELLTDAIQTAEALVADLLR
jgi:hypothetical protein